MGFLDHPEEYEVGERWGSPALQNKQKHVYATFPTKELAQKCLDEQKQKVRQQVK